MRRDPANQVATRGQKLRWKVGKAVDLPPCHVCARIAYIDRLACSAKRRADIPGRCQRVAKLRLQAKALLKAHPKCTNCGVLFGGKYHEFEPTPEGVCPPCFLHLFPYGVLCTPPATRPRVAVPRGTGSLRPAQQVMAFS